MIRWMNLEYLWYFGIVSLLLLLFVWAKTKGQNLNLALGPRLFPFLTSSVSKFRSNLRIVLRVIVLSFIIVSLLRPQTDGGKEKISHQGVEIVFAVDVSESMLAEDVKPSRLEFAKADMMKLIEAMPGNKLAVEAFAGTAVLMSPLTQDSSATKMYIESLSPMVVSAQGTSLSEALKVALGAFERGGSEGPSQSVTRVIIVASDGEDHEPGLDTVIADAVKKGIHIYTLAYGTEKGAPIPVRDGLGNVRGYKQDRSGETVITTVVGKELAVLAEKGNGIFAYTTGQIGYVQKIVDSVGELEKVSFGDEYQTVFREQFQWPLCFAFLFLCIEILFFERRSHFRFWKGRFEVPPS